MAFQAVPDGVEVVFKAIQNSVPVVNVYNVRDTTTHSESRLLEIGNTFLDWWHASLQPIISNSYVLQEVVITSLELATGPQVSISLSTDNQGDLTGEQVAGNAAAVISWRTSSIGRSFRGRTYVGGLDAAATDTAQAMSPSFASALAAAGVDLIDALNGIGAILAVLSRFALGVQRVTGLLTDIISVIVDTKIDSQRRRTAN